MTPVAITTYAVAAVQQWQKPERVNMDLTTRRRNEEAARVRQAALSRAEAEKVATLEAVQETLTGMGVDATARCSIQLLQPGRWLVRRPTARPRGQVSVLRLT
jgi:DNA helicase TIP49 (TBP-interacting protein)